MIKRNIVAAQMKFFRHEGHYEFLIIVQDLLNRFPGVKATVIRYFDSFVLLIEKEGRLVDTSKKSDYTKLIAAADATVDSILLGLKEAVASAMHHFDPTIADAAKSLNNRIKAFGNITHKSYETETAAVGLLLTDLEGLYAPKIAIVGLTEWVLKLREAATAFKLLLNLRMDERAARVPDNIKDVRREVDIVYHDIVAYIEADATLDETGKYEEFIPLMNAQIEYFNRHETHHRTKKSITHVIVDAIPPQPYTGKAVIYIPRLSFKDGDNEIELAFSTDFTVKFKNNTAVGVAEIIIKGKGAYKGEVTVTFNIIEN